MPDFMGHNSLLPNSEVGGHLRAIYMAKNLNQRYSGTEIGEITATNPDGSFNILLRARSESLPGVIYEGSIQLMVGDWVAVAAIQGDPNRMVILGPAPRQAGGIQTTEYFVNFG